MAQAKICGLARAEDVAVAVAAGARAVGAILYPRSKRAVEPRELAALFDAARGMSERVAVLVDPDDTLLDQVVASCAVDTVQLHGHETPERVAEVRRRTGLSVMKAIGVATRADLDAVAGYAKIADRLLLDAKPPPNFVPGGNGLAFDWRLVEDASLPSDWGLAGGLNPGNVTAAIALTGVSWVDVATGVEEAPGVKDHAAIRAFVAAAALANKGTT